MNCGEAISHLQSYADGELGGMTRAAVHEHLVGCDRCRAELDAIERIRQALCAHWSDVRAPDSLVERVEALTVGSGSASFGGGASHSPALPPSIDRGVAIPAEVEDEAGMEFGETYSEYVRSQRPAWKALKLPAALAALIGLGAIMWSALLPPGIEPLSVSSVPPADVAFIRIAHLAAVEEGPAKFHDESLPRQLTQARVELEARLGFRVAAPVLTSSAFEFRGARQTTLAGSAAAHLLYTSPVDQTALSAFSVMRLEALGGYAVARDQRHYLLAESADAAVCAWHDGMETHVLCADIPSETLLEIADQVRVVGGPTPEVLRRAYLAAVR